LFKVFRSATAIAEFVQLIGFTEEGLAKLNMAIGNNIAIRAANKIMAVNRSD
jgi:hypothetical protein